MSDKTARLRRAKRGRMKMKEIGATRLCVHRTPRHIYAQVIAPDCQSVIAHASTLDKEFKSLKVLGGNVNAAEVIGKMIAVRALEKGIKKVAFDRSGFKYHGRLKALADGAREGGLEF